MKGMVKFLLLGMAVFFGIIGTAGAMEPLWVYHSDDGIQSVSLSANGAYISAIAEKVYLFRLTGEKVWTNVGGQRVTISGDNAFVAVGSDVGLLIINETGNILWEDRELNLVKDLDLSANGKLVTTAVGTTISKYRISTGEIVVRRVLPSLNAVAVSADGKLLAAGEREKIEVYDDKHRVWSYVTTGNVNHVTFTSESDYLVASSDYDVLFFHSSGSLLWTYKTGGEITSLAATPDSAYIAAASRDGKVYLFNKEGTPLWNRSVGSWPTGVGVSMDGRYLVTGTTNQNIYLLNRTGAVQGSYKSGSGIRCMGISANGDIFAAGSMDGSLYVFSTLPATAPVTPVTTGITGTSPTPTLTLPPNTVYQTATLESGSYVSVVIFPLAMAFVLLVGLGKRKKQG